jgi:hypothetical protein
MAGTLALNVEILGQFNKLTTATQGAGKQLQGLQNTAKSISAGMGKAFAAIGVGFSLNFLKNELAEAGKAAVAEAKSMEILSIAMQNTGSATSATVKAAEASIKKMSLQSAVADDQLRPAFQKLFIATKSVTESNKLLQVALDTSAATGKDLDTVTQAMARSLEGSDTALNKLVPSLKGVDDPLKALGETFAGAATAAANLDPYQRMNVAFGEIQESVGLALMPALNDFATYLVDSVPKIQAFFAELTDPSTELGGAWENLGAIFKSTADEFNKMLAVFGLSEISFKDVLNFVTTLTAGFGQLFFFVGRVADIIGSLLSLNFGRAFDIASNFGSDYGKFVGSQNRATSLIGSSGQMSQDLAMKNVTINVNNGNVTAQQIADKVNKGNRATGTNLIRSN